MAKKTKPKRDKRQRQERRFVAKAASNPVAVLAASCVSALLLGAGAWAYFFAKSFAEDEKLRTVPSYLVAAGAIVLGIAIWFGTSSEGAVRVGDPGVALEKGDLRRIPWFNVGTIAYASGALSIEGKDESNAPLSIRLSHRAHGDAIAWIVREALARIPKRVADDDETRNLSGKASEHAGQKLLLEPVQVVGRRCAATSKTISYEPDARVCERCERVYLKTDVPKKCKCGNGLAARGADAEREEEPEEAPEETAS
jgi:hypothetical protein